MIVNAYLKVTQKQWEDIKEKYVEPKKKHIKNILHSVQGMNTKLIDFKCTK